MADEVEVVEAEPQAEPEVNIDTAMDAVDRALKAVESEEAPDNPEPDSEASDAEPDSEAGGERERNADGTFKAKDAEPSEPAENVKTEEKNEGVSHFAEAPSRFSPDAKAAWKDAPEPVRAEINRAIKELETGLEKYREDATSFDGLREYHDIAKQHGTSIKDALDRYTALERMLAGENKMAAISDVMGYAGVSPQEFALQILQQSGEELSGDQINQVRSAGQQDSLVRSLRSEIAALKDEINGVSSRVQSQQDAVLEQKVIEFAADKPRFDELAEDIKFFLESGRTNDLAKAYDLAEMLNPLPAEPAPPKEPTPEVQPKKGSLSVTGAPASGSDPANRKPPSSAQEAVNRAFSHLGL